jgi:hypothetical protein
MLDAGAIETNFAAGGLFKTGDQTQGSGFAASRGAKQGEELAGRELERNAVDGMVGGVVLRDVTKL